MTVLAGQDAHGLLVRLPGLRADPQQLTVDLTLRHPRAVAVVNLQLEELTEEQRQTSKDEEQWRVVALDVGFLADIFGNCLSVNELF